MKTTRFHRQLVLVETSPQRGLDEEWEVETSPRSYPCFAWEVKNSPHVMIPIRSNLPSCNSRRISNINLRTNRKAINQPRVHKGKDLSICPPSKMVICDCHTREGTSGSLTIGVAFPCVERRSVDPKKLELSVVRV